MKRLLFAGTAVALPWLALAAVPAGSPPPGVSTNLPYGQQQLNTDNLALNQKVPYTNTLIWKPFPGAATIDTTGGSTNGRTQVTTIELEDQPTMIMAVWQNQSSLYPWTLTNANYAASSEWAQAGYTGATPGISPYDANGNATSFYLFTFKNCGNYSDPDFNLSTPGTSCSTTYTTTANSNSNTLTFGSITCPAQGSLLTITTSTENQGVNIYPQSTIATCTAGTTSTIVASLAPYYTVPSGTTVYASAPGGTLATASQAPISTLFYSDWMIFPQIPRIDSPFSAGAVEETTSGTVLGTVSSVGSTTLGSGGTSGSITLSAGLPQAVTAGTEILSCPTSVTTTAALAPSYALTLTSTTGIPTPSGGATIWLDTGIGSLGIGPEAAVWGYNYVSSIAGSVVTQTLPIPPALPNASNTWTAGTPVFFSTVHTLTATLTPGSSTITVDSTADLSTGTTYSMYTSTQWGTGVGSNTVNATVVDATHLSTGTLTNQQSVPAGMTLTIGLQTTLSQPAVSASNLGTAYTNFINGMVTVAPGVPLSPVTYASTGLQLNKSVTGAVASGTVLPLCVPVTPIASAASGSNTLTFTQTTYPKTLLTMRTNVGSTAANYASETAMGTANWVQLTGQGNYLGYKCSIGVDGVLNNSSLSNSSGNCSNAGIILPYAVLYYSPTKGVNVIWTGDSHWSGTTTSGAKAPMFARLAGMLTTTTLTPYSQPVSATRVPVAFANMAWAGTGAQWYAAQAVPIIKAVPKSLVFIQGTTPNGVGSFNAFYNGMQVGIANALAALVQKGGGVPFILDDYPRQKAGCNYGDTSATGNDKYRLQWQAQLNSRANAAGYGFDFAANDVDPVWGASYHNPSYTFDCVHMDDIGHQALLRTYIPTCINGFLDTNMVFIARLKRTSSIWHMWRAHNRVGGVIAQVQFKWVPGDNYVTGELDSIQMAALRAHGDVELEMCGGGIPGTSTGEPLPQKPEAKITVEPSLPLPQAPPAPIRRPPLSSSLSSSSLSSSPSAYQHGNGHHKSGRR